MRKRIYCIVLISVAVTGLLLNGCAKKTTQPSTDTQISQMITESQTDTQEEITTQDTQTTQSEQQDTQTSSQEQASGTSSSQEVAQISQTQIPGTGIKYEQTPGAPWIAIDAGHQAQGNSQKEPIGPGASETKAKVSSGTCGTTTGVPEYQVTLQVALKLRDALLADGYNVLMIRETNDVNISNAERAQLANSVGASAFLRIHVDGAENTSAKGVTVLCPTAQNPYCSSIYSASRTLSDNLSSAIISATGAQNRGVSEVDTMSGINWCTVPVSIIEMGFMTNATEDQLLITEDYQNKLVDGMVKGVEQSVKK